MPQSLNVHGIFGFVRVLRNPSLLRPSCIAKDISRINFEALKSNSGIQAICFDKDNTITAPYSSEIYDDHIRDSLERCVRVFGAHRVAIMSNSAGSSDDSPGNREAALLETSLSQSITESVAVIRHGSKKPNCGQAISKHFSLQPKNIMIIGDRLLTDILMANESGMLSTLVMPFSGKNDNKPASFIRSLEHIYLAKYLRGPAMPELQRLIIS